MSNKGKNSNYKYKLQKSLEEIEAKDRAFREKKRKLYLFTNITAIVLMLISLALLLLYSNGTFPNADLIFAPLLAISIFLMAVRYKTVNRRLYLICNLLAILELAITIVIYVLKIRGGMI